MTENAYDRVPYLSHAFAKTTPENLSVTASLFGLETPDFSSARVLELGCASGGNIIPLAEHYPNSQFVGVDNSSKQIQEGLDCISATELSNIELFLKSFSEVEADFGKFDFIIAHGIHSWVGHELQRKVLKICSDCLSENGVAYVSYNTLPGWNTAKTVRDAMIYHTQNLSEPEDKAKQARFMLRFLIESTDDSNEAHAISLLDEHEILEKNGDYYLLHEYLESDNNPVYFHEFMNQANSFELQYIADAQLNTMSLDSLPESTAEALRALNNVVQLEQYMDFIQNRKFRSTLLCHQTVNINRNIAIQNIETLYLSSNLSSDETLDEAMFSDDVECGFQFESLKVSTRDRLSKLIHKVLIEQHRAQISIDELLNAVRGHDSTLSKEQIRNHIFKHFSLSKLVISGALKLHLSAPCYSRQVSLNPKVTKVARYQAEAGRSVANCRHEQLELDTLERALVVNMDGNRTVHDLIDDVADLAQSGDIEITRSDGSEFESALEMREQLEILCVEKIEKFAEMALFVSTSD